MGDQQLPTKRIIKVKRKKKRVIRNNPKMSKSPRQDDPADALMFMPQPQMQTINAQSPEDVTLAHTLATTTPMATFHK